MAALSNDAPLGNDPRFADATSRATNEAELIDTLTSVFTARPAAEWEERMLGADVACVAVEPMLGGISSGLQLPGGLAEQLGMMTTVEHPLFGQVPRTRRLYELSRSGQSLGASCLIGQHTDAILDELGYSGEQIAELRAKGVVG